MTEEENKAIEILNVVNDTKYTCHYYTIEDLKAIDTVLNLIEKLQKENLLLSAKENMSAYFEFKRNYIPKDKIREKIKNIKENYSEFSECSIYKSIDFLQELLEEN